MAELSDAQKRKLIKELRGASKLHAGQADRIEKTLAKKKKKWVTQAKKHWMKWTPMNVSARLGTLVLKSVCLKALPSLST